MWGSFFTRNPFRHNPPLLYFMLFVSMCNVWRRCRRGSRLLCCLPGDSWNSPAFIQVDGWLCLETCQKHPSHWAKLLLSESTTECHVSAKPSPLACSCLLYTNKQWHRLMKHWPTFRNSTLPGRQAGTQIGGWVMLIWHAAPACISTDTAGYSMSTAAQALVCSLCFWGSAAHMGRDAAAHTSLSSSLSAAWMWLLQGRFGGMVLTQAWGLQLALLLQKTFAHTSIRYDRLSSSKYDCDQETFH